MYTFTPDQLSSGEANNDNNNSNSNSGNSAIYTIAVRPDGTGFVAGGADKTARFFRFVLSSGSSILQAQCLREMSLPAELLAVKYSHHKGKITEQTQTRSPLLVAMALLDHTVRIVYDDSLRLCLTLYGHALPVLCLDIASDNMLVVTGSADKTLKLWGLDFGDCHRSLFGHSDTVTSVQFVAFSHYFFSASKDGSIRYWDGDRFEQVLYLPGHKGTVWSVGVGLEGAFVFSAGQDRSLRRWMRDVDDLVFVEEEKERALEAQVDQQAIQVSAGNTSGSGSGSGVMSGMVVMLENETAAAASASSSSGTAAGAAATTSLVALKGGDLLMQTLDLLEEHVPIASLSLPHMTDKSSDPVVPAAAAAAPASIATPHAHPMFLSLSPLQYFQRCLTTQIPRADLEASLLILPMSYVVLLVRWLEVFLVCHHGVEIETTTRCLVTILLCHQRGLSMQASALLPSLLAIRRVLTQRMDAYKTMLGMNTAGWRFVQQSLDAAQEEKQAMATVFATSVGQQSEQQQQQQPSAKKKRRA